jgi:hypothetical protein
MTPEGWQRRTLSEVADRVTAGGTPKAGDPRYCGAGFPFLKIEEITSKRGLYVREAKTTITQAALLVTLTLFAGVLANAEQEPGPPSAPKPKVSIRKDHDSVILTWVGGEPPFLVVREEPQADGEHSKISYPAEDLQERRFVDHDIAPGKRYWYRVFDSKAEPEIFAISPDRVVAPGDLVLVTGVGFSKNCADVHVDQGGDPWPPYECSFTELRFRVPGDIVNGTMSILTPTGMAFQFEGGWKRSKAQSW